MDYSDAVTLIETQFPNDHEDIIKKLYKSSVIMIAQMCQENKKPNYLSSRFLSHVTNMDEHRQNQYVMNPAINLLLEKYVYPNILKNAGCCVPATSHPGMIAGGPNKVNDETPEPVKEPEPDDDDGGGLMDLFG